MAERKGDNQKLKMLYLSKIFHEQTDEEHGLTMRTAKRSTRTSRS